MLFRSGKKDVGVVAQEVSGIWNFAVRENSGLQPFISGENNIDYLKVDYHKFVPLLLSAVKELSQEVKKIKSGS